MEVPFTAMATIVGWCATTTLVGLGGMHVVWAVRGSGGTSVAIPTRPDGTPALAPSTAATLGVAALLFTAAGTVAVHLVQAHPPWIVHVGAWGVAAVFGMRAIGEGRYVGLFRRVRGTAFARWDAWCFTPLCAALSASVAAVALRR